VWAISPDLLLTEFKFNPLDDGLPAPAFDFEQLLPAQAPSRPRAFQRRISSTFDRLNPAPVQARSAGQVFVHSLDLTFSSWLAVFSLANRISLSRPPTAIRSFLTCPIRETRRPQWPLLSLVRPCDSPVVVNALTPILLFLFLVDIQYMSPCPIIDCVPCQRSTIC